MRIKTMLQSAAVIGLAVVAGLLGVAGTWALWSASATANPGTVKAADFTVLVNGQALKSSAATTASLSTEGGPLTPTTDVYAALTVQNSSNAGGPFAIEVSVPALLTIEDARMPATVTVESVRKTTEKCAAAPFPATPTTGQTTTVINKNASASFCLRIGLPDETPSQRKPSEIALTVPVSAAQAPPTTVR
jgi:predicted ribosomally synthesized peptide with SipW-like signal peptide